MEPGICQPPASGVAPSLADNASALLRKYFDEYPNTFLTQHHIESYESFIFREMPAIIAAENPLTILKEPLNEKEGVYKYKTEIFVGGTATNPADLAIDVGAPIITLDNGKTVRRMFPAEARLRDLTYEATFQADILIRLTFTMPTTNPAEPYTSVIRELPIYGFPLLRIPVLLRSKLCATHGASKDLLYEMGECRNDQGGYFIIDGSEKLLITRQEQAFNSMYISPKPATDQKLATYASVICQHPKTKQSRRVVLARIRTPNHDNDGPLRISIPFVKGAIPLFALFRALGVESDEEIVRMIVPDPHAPLASTMESLLISSIQDAYPITTTVHAIEFIRTLTKGFIVATVLNVLHEHLFSHVPDRPLARAQYLAEFVRKLLRVELRQEPPTNRDDIRNQRLLPTGTLLRGLFTDCWKDWKKLVIKAVDEQYNYNKSLYQDENFLTIFSAGNIGNVLASKKLNDSIMRGFRGRWGTNKYNMKTGVVQPVARISYLDAMSHTRRVVSDFDTSMKLVGPRHLHPSQVGYFCTSETPTGAHIGATRNLSILTTSSIATEMEPLMNWLLTRGGVSEIAGATRNVAARATSVQINGGTIGFTEKPVELTRVLKLMKWTACLPPTASISFNTAENVIRIYTDDGRPLRPLWHLSGAGAWPQIMLDVQAGKKELPAWRDLVCGTFPLTLTATLYSADFIDPLAENPAPDFSDYEAALAPYAGAIEYIDPYEGNEAYVSWWGNVADLSPEHSHAEIHPSTMLGLLASMIPFANHNQSPRNQLSCSQSKQGIGYYATNYENRFDTYGSMLCYGEGALCRTIVHDAVAGGGMPYGTNIIFALNCFNGYNQDDGILFNRSSIERGLFRSLALRSYQTVEEDDPQAKAVYRIGNPRNVLSWYDLKTGADYSALDDYGIIKEGTVINDKTVLVGRYLTLTESGKIKDASLMPTVFTKGRVDKVVVLHQANGMRLVRIRILEERVPELGDKFSSRHGQKGTMGMLMDAVDMPRTADGMVPDVIVNPHCIPSRMTVAQMLEQVFGKYGAIVGAKINATTFMNDEQSFTAIANALEELGVQREGEEILYSGITGKMYSSSIFMGPLNFMRLKHLAQDKINARPSGRKEQRTHQPTGGRGNEGGMRIGEMERDSLIAHGGMAFVQESMMKRSDGTSFWVCNGCGTIPIYNEATDLFVCALCDGPLTYQGNTEDTLGLVLPVRKSRTTFSRVEMPYALKLLDQELTTFMNAGFRYITEKHARTFREPTLMKFMELEAVEEETQGVAEAALDDAAADVTQVAMLPVELAGDPGAEDAVADAQDEGEPAMNDLPAPEVPPAGVAVIEFYSKTPQYKEFSNFYPVTLNLADKVWPTVEHYFQAMKFPNHPDYQETIRVAKTPAQAKRMGKTKTIPIRDDWNTYRDEVMLTAVREKFSDRHPELKAKLLATGDAVLKEASPLDNYWGIGKKKLGQNKLGKILMQVRDELKAAQAAVAPAVAADALLTTEAVPVPAAPLEPGVAAAAPAVPAASQAPAAPQFPEAPVEPNSGPSLKIIEIDTSEPPELDKLMLEAQAPVPAAAAPQPAAAAPAMVPQIPQPQVSFAPPQGAVIQPVAAPVPAPAAVPAPAPIPVEDSDVKVVTVSATLPKA